MKVTILSKGPNGSSRTTSSVRGFCGPQRSMQPLDPDGTLSFTFDGVDGIEFELQGPIEAAERSAICVTVRATARKGEGKVIVKKEGVELFVADITIGGNVTVGLSIGSL